MPDAFWVLLVVVGIFLFVLVKHLVSKIRTNQRTLQGIMDHIELGIVVLDRDLRVEGDTSRSVAELLDQIGSLDRGDLLNLLEKNYIGRSIQNFDQLRQLLKGVLGKDLESANQTLENLPQEFALSGKQGMRFLTLRWRGIADRERKVRRILVTLRDVTQERELRNELSLQQQKLINLGEMTASIAHDIASPSHLLANIQTTLHRELKSIRDLLLQLLGQDSDPEAVQVLRVFNEHLDLCQETLRTGKIAVDRIIAVQSAIRNQSRAEEAPERFLVRPLIEESLTLSRSIGHHWRVQINCSEAVSLSGFRSQLGQVLTNILNNAFDVLNEKGTREGKICDILISVHLEANRCTLRIEDAGPGIPPEMRDRIFEPFFTTKPLGVGTGLGLPICRRIVKQHKGELSVETSQVLGAFLFIMSLAQSA